MKRRLPSFAEDREAIVPQGSRMYSSILRPGFTAYIGLQVSDKDDSFTVNLAWSPHGKYPESTMTTHDEVSKDGDCSFRLGHLFGRRQDFWWYLARTGSIWDENFTVEEDSIEMAIPRVDPYLDDVFDMIESYAVPYFEKKSTKWITFERRD